MCADASQDLGYDDNSPLTGVTGGGLPAEIWRQTMDQVHNELPARPLPMIRPDSYPVASFEETIGGPAAPERPRQRDPSKTNPTLIELLGQILGGN